MIPAVDEASAENRSTTLEEAAFNDQQDRAYKVLSTIAEAKKNAAQEGGTEYNIGKMETKNPPKDKRSPSERGGQSASAALVMDSEYRISQENVPVKDSTTRFPFLKKTKALLTS